MPTKPKKPYLLRALNDWIVDSGFTPYIMVDATPESVVVPASFVKSGKILLNVSMNAVRDLHLGDEAISFSARFGGQPHAIYVPVEHVIAIYARENGEGMMFDEPAEKEPSAAQGKEPSAAQGKEPSAAQDREPSAAQDREPAASATGESSTDGAKKPGGHLKLVD